MLQLFLLIGIVVFSLVYITSKQQSTNSKLAKMSGEWDTFVKKSLTKYNHRDKTKKDVLHVLKEYKGLRPKVDNYTFNDGSIKELFSIDGTIPVKFKGNTYNIPICMWLMETHPDNAPLCFVTPTADMLIKPSINVDVNGRVYLPYLQDWKYPSSNLVGMVQVLSAVFSENSPLYAKSIGANPAYSPLATKRPAPVMPVSPTTASPCLTVPKYMEPGLAESSSEVTQLKSELNLLKDKLRVTELRSDRHSLKFKEKKFDEPDPEMCKLCTSRRRNTVFLCGHTACKECAESLINCIRCKQRITKKILLKD